MLISDRIEHLMPLWPENDSQDWFKIDNFRTLNHMAQSYSTVVVLVFVFLISTWASNVLCFLSAFLQTKQLDSYMRTTCASCQLLTLGFYLSYFFFQTRKSYLIFLVTALEIKAGPVGPIDWETRILSSTCTCLLVS